MKTVCYENHKTNSYSTSSVILDITNQVNRYSRIPVGYVELGSVVNVCFKEMSFLQRLKYLFTNKLS